MLNLNPVYMPIFDCHIHQIAVAVAVLIPEAGETEKVATSNQPIRSYIGLQRHFEGKPESIQSYFYLLPKLIEDSYPFDLAISYVFMRLEQAYHRILYGGCIKLHAADTQLTQAALENWHIDKSNFTDKFEIIFGKKIPSAILAKLDRAKKIRDSIMHGKSPGESEKRNTIAEVLDHAEDLNEFVNKCAGFQPFGSMQGFSGASTKLDKSTTRWMLKGMGFAV